MCPSTDAQAGVPADGDICRLRGRERAARRALQARDCRWGDCSWPLAFRRLADVLEPRIFSTVADRGVARADARAIAAECVFAAGRKSLGFDRERIPRPHLVG